MSEIYVPTIEAFIDILTMLSKYSTYQKKKKKSKYAGMRLDAYDHDCSGVLSAFYC